MLFNDYLRSGRPDTIRILISIEEAVMIPLNTNNPLGQLEFGWIRLRGVLLPGKVTRPEPSTSPQDKLKVYFSADSADTDFWIFPDIKDEIFDQSIFCLLVSTMNRYNGTLIQGLALHCTDTEKAMYRRVGLFEGTHKSPNQDIPVQYSRSTRRVELSENAALKTIVLI